jgi:hypothetical protein
MPSVFFFFEMPGARFFPLSLGMRLAVNVMCGWQLSWDRTGVSLTVGQGFYSSYGGTFTTLQEDYYVTKATLSGSGATTLADVHPTPCCSYFFISECVYVCSYTWTRTEARGYMYSCKL